MFQSNVGLEKHLPRDGTCPPGDRILGGAVGVALGNNCCAFCRQCTMQPHCVSGEGCECLDRQTGCQSTGVLFLRWY